ncbi:hypothetical protein K458DRAFT_398083 [Lentithecium fluviatile CBS 122367]|uniref:Uncharacterized protein n=1 Tax=Lentithecium fluviatile CBS 122367 TaxID=1168545 RepID=A0A6G1JNB7_9PLEO|nr:hypothetical protein K458DRAFT_398083 [Lentithecium fluviatile CBS 122367]
MKRRVSDSDMRRLQREAPQNAMCQRRGNPLITTSVESIIAALALAEEALHSTQQSTAEAPESSIQHWVENCAAVCDLEIMAAPPTSRSAYGNDRGHRSVKCPACSYVSQTPSPSK